MEFSLFEIFGLLQKVDLISRFLAKIDIVDFITSLVIIGTIWGKMGAGTKRVETSFETKFASFETSSTTRFENFERESTKAFTAFDKKIDDLKEDNNKTFTAFDKKIDDFKQESKERLTENTNSIKEMGIALKRNIDSDKLELKSDISSINQRVDTLNQTVINLVANKKLNPVANKKLK